MSTWKEKEDEARRQHILDVAEKLFSEKGLAETSIADIAREAEFGVGTLYKHFTDRNNLVESLIADRLSAHLDEVENSLGEGNLSPPELVKNMVEAYLLSVQKRALFFRVYFTHFHPVTSRCGKEQPFCGDMEDRQQGMFRRLDEVFETGIAQGYFANPGSANYFSVALFGMLMSFYFYAEFRCGGMIDVPAIKTAITDIFFKQNLLTEKEV